MKKLLALFFAAACISAHAQVPAADKTTVDRCTQEGGILVMAATGRDQGITPQDMLKMVSEAAAVPLARRKKLINLVYFDPKMADLHPGPHDEGHVQMTYEENCERNWKSPYVPLQ